MDTETVDIRSYTFSRADRFLLDANIWLFIYGPVAYPARLTDVYSTALRKMRTSGCKIYLDVLVLSEFINVFARWEYNQMESSKKPKDFKEFRRSEAFKPVAEEIAVNAKKISSMALRSDSLFESVDISALLTEYEAGDSDFNDLILAETCKSKGLTLITHDADFKGRDVAILTANKNLLG